jgi:hypothetical protein
MMKTLAVIGIALAIGVPGMALAQRAGAPPAEVRRVEVNRIDTRPIDTGRIDDGRITRRDVVTGTRIVDRRREIADRDTDRVRRPDVRPDRPDPSARRRAYEPNRRRLADPSRRRFFDPSRRRLHDPSRRRFHDPSRRRGR